jgi:Tfp pilus assembly pilus retraction ATPase PilT
MEAGSAEGMTTLNASLLYLLRQGRISREDAIRKSTQPKELIDRLYAS